MKLLEFRIWVPDTKTMEYDVWIGDLLEGITPDNIDGYTEIMQWTGLLDKNGNKVFEGDILGGIYGNGTVEYCDVCKSFQYHAMGTCFACEGEVHWGELVADDGKLEVVGNKWENPERLEENL